MQRQRGGLVPIGEVFSDLDGPVKKAPQPSPQAQHHFTQADQVHQLVGGQRSGPRSGIHGAADGIVLPAPHQPQQPASVQACQRPLCALHDRPARLACGV